MNKIEEYLKDHVWISKSPVLNPKDATIQSFIGDWLTNNDIDAFFEIINKNYDKFIGFVYKPSKHMYSFAGLEDKINKAKKNWNSS